MVTTMIMHRIKLLGIIIKMMSNRDYDLAEDVFFYYFLNRYRCQDNSLRKPKDI